MIAKEVEGKKLSIVERLKLAGEAGFADPATSSALAKSGVVLRMNLSEPDTVITVDLVEQEIHIGEDAPEPLPECLVVATLLKLDGRGSYDAFVWTSGILLVPSGASREAIEAAAVASDAFVNFAANAPPKKVIVVPGRLVNIVI